MYKLGTYTTTVLAVCLGKSHLSLAANSRDSLSMGQTGASLPPRGVGIRSSILLCFDLEASETQGNGLNGDQQNGEVQRSAALVAERAPVGLLGHGHMRPTACPRQEGVDLIRCVNRIEEDDGDQRCG